MEEITFDQLIRLNNSLSPNELTTTRVGLIPILERKNKYIMPNGMVTLSGNSPEIPHNSYYLLGIDRRTKKLSDFGGHCMIKGQNVEKPIECLQRELIEEAGILLSSYLINKMNDPKVRQNIHVFVINSNGTRKIEVFMKFTDEEMELDPIILRFQPNEEIESIGLYDKNDLLKTKPEMYISSVEKFMKFLL